MPEQNTKISVASEKPNRAGIHSVQGLSRICATTMMNMARPRKKSSRMSRGRDAARVASRGGVRVARAEPSDQRAPASGIAVLGAAAAAALVEQPLGRRRAGPTAGPASIVSRSKMSRCAWLPPTRCSAPRAAPRRTKARACSPCASASEARCRVLSRVARDGVHVALLARRVPRDAAQQRFGGGVAARRRPAPACSAGRRRPRNRRRCAPRRGRPVRPSARRRRTPSISSRPSSEAALAMSR